jgi:hypothetical protein
MDDNYLMDKKIELIIDMKLKKITTELTGAQALIRQMSDEMNVLNHKIERLNNGAMQSAPQFNPMPSAQAVAPEAPKVMPAQMQTSTQPVSQKQQEANYNQRVGSLKPGDVNLQAMFYFGGKK